MNAGCRLLEKDALIWSQVRGLTKFGISFVNLNGRAYVSGLRFLGFIPLLSDEEYQLGRIGLVNTSNERIFEMGQDEVPKTLKVCMTINGIVGLKFELSGPAGLRSCSAGEFEVLDDEGGFAELSLGDDVHFAGLLVGIDACKLVSIQLLEEPPTADVATGMSQHRPGTRSAEIWNPKMPADRPEWQFPSAFPSQTFNLCLNIDLAGPNTSRQASITKVVVYMGEFPSVFFGMSFVYSDESEQLFGRTEYTARDAKTHSCVARSFFIAGAQGEYIDSIGTSHAKHCDTIQEISISTNSGRVCTFRLHGADSYEEREASRTAMRLSPGKRFAGLYAKLQSPRGHFRDLSARTMSVKDETSTVPDLGNWKSHQFEMTTENFTPAKEMLAHTGGFAFTTANLSHIKNIRISTGRKGTSRGENHISGIWFEYEDSAVPVIVGQWIAECGAIELGPDEQLAEIMTWHDFTNRFQRVKFGPIIGIRLVTTEGTNTEILRQKIEGAVCLQFKESIYEKLDSLVWGFNHHWDHVRVFYSRNQAMYRQGLVYTPISRPVPDWAVREKLFLQSINPAGRLDPVSTIEVSFKTLSSEPSGLSFAYQSGKIQTIGHRGETPQAIALQDKENLTRMEVGIQRGNRIGYIKFETDQDRNLVFTSDPGEMTTLGVHQSDVFILERTEGFEPTPLRANKMPASAGKLAGFWAVPKRQDRCLRYPMFGPIFEQLEN